MSLTTTNWNEYWINKFLGRRVWQGVDPLASMDFKPPTRRWNGVDADGHRVYVTATEEEIKSGELTVWCGDCEAHVLPKWDDHVRPRKDKWVSDKDKWVIDDVEFHDIPNKYDLVR